MKLCGSEMLKIQEKSSKNVEKSKKEALPGLCRLLQPKSLPGKAFVASLEQNKRWPAVYEPNILISFGISLCPDTLIWEKHPAAQQNDIKLKSNN